jgi:uncharacterized membrane protein YgdD (TMEM256/DUF423 family)
MNASVAFRIVAALGFLGVVLGAFGAHGLKDLLSRNDTVAIWEKAVLYHLVHTVALLWVSTQRPFPALPWSLFVAGIVVFSGTLYLLAVTNVRWLGAITPIGGLCLIAGWLTLVFCSGH